MNAHSALHEMIADWKALQSLNAISINTGMNSTAIASQFINKTLEVAQAVKSWHVTCEEPDFIAARDDFEREAAKISPTTPLDLENKHHTFALAAFQVAWMAVKCETKLCIGGNHAERWN